VEFIGCDLAHLQPPKEDWRSVVKRSQVGGLQHKEAARHSAGYHWRIFECHKIAFVAFRSANLHPDVGPGDQSPQSCDVSTGDSWANDPEVSVFNQEILCLGDHLGSAYYPLVIRRELDRTNRADFDALVFDFGFAGFESLR